MGCYGDGGAVFTSNVEFAKLIRQIARHGQEKRYYHTRIGMNSRLDTIQAAILDVKLKKLNLHNDLRKKQAEEYFYRLENIQDLKLLKKDSFDFESVWHLFPIRTSNRDQLKSYLQEKGVDTLIHYPISIMKQKHLVN